jgi:hypothetical protein
LAVFFFILLSRAVLHGASCLAQNPGKKVPGWDGGNKSDYESGAESDGQIERDRGFKTVLQAGQIKGSRRYENHEEERAVVAPLLSLA